MSLAITVPSNPGLHPNFLYNPKHEVAVDVVPSIPNDLVNLPKVEDCKEDSVEKMTDELRKKMFTQIKKLSGFPVANDGCITPFANMLPYEFLSRAISLYFATKVIETGENIFFCLSLSDDQEKENKMKVWGAYYQRVTDEQIKMIWENSCIWSVNEVRGIINQLIDNHYLLTNKIIQKVMTLEQQLISLKASKGR